MSWWETGYGNDVIGDEPADILQAAFFRASDEYRSRQHALPPLEEFLRAMAKSMNVFGANVLADVEPTVQVELVLRLESGSTISSGAYPAEPDANLLQAMREAFEMVARAYQNRFR